MNVSVLSQKRRLDDLFSKISLLSYNAELQAHWARYLCVLVSGFIETSVREIYSEYANRNSAPNIGNFVQTELGSFQNAKMGKILEVTGSFNRDWKQELEDATEGELKDAVDSIVANRHSIAHGQMVGITYARVNKYYKSVIDVLELLEGQCA